MKFRLIMIALILVFVNGCKEIKVPADFQIGSFSSEDIQKGLNIATNVYNAAKDLTPEQEYYIGRSVAANILGRYRVYNNPDINNYVNKIGRLVTINSPKPEIFGGYHFTVLDSTEINAFATPGGFVFITRGMLKMCKNEDELAAVLAHEVSHVQLKHGLKSIKESRLTAIASKIGLDAAKEKIAKKYDSEELREITDAFADSLDDIVNTLVVNGYSRAYEKDADSYALNILVNSGYSDYAMLGMLEKMDVLLLNDQRGFGSTHPKASERINLIRNAVRYKYSDIYINRTKRFKYFMKNV